MPSHLRTILGIVLLFIKVRSKTSALQAAGFVLTAISIKSKANGNSTIYTESVERVHK
jgi:hypothetical protein